MHLEGFFFQKDYYPINFLKFLNFVMILMWLAYGLKYQMHWSGIIWSSSRFCLT